MTTTTIIIGIVASIIGTVGATAICGTCVYVINSLKDMIKDNSARSERGDEAIKNEMLLIRANLAETRRDDKEVFDRAIASLKTTDEDRRQDVRNLYEKTSDLNEKIANETIERLRAEIEMLKNSK